MKDRFELLVFDWDGTLFDSVDWITECIQHAAEDCGWPPPTGPAARSVIGLSLARALETLFPDVDAAEAERLMAAYRHYYDSRTIDPDSLFSGVREMLETLRGRSYKLAVATGKNSNGLRHALEATATTDLFHAVRSAEETASKPHPEMLLQIIAELNAAPARTLMIGDSVHDLRMAMNAGTEAIGVACGANSRDELLALRPLACLTHPAELLEYLV